MDKQSKVFISGATGLLGGVLTDKFAEECVLWPQGYRQRINHPRFVKVNLENDQETHDALNKINPDIIIHLAALANVDACEASPADAYRLNVGATRALVDWMRLHRPNGVFVYASTDQIYDGPGPHVEDHVAPSNTYAITKLWGEDIVQCLDRFIILRLNFFAAPTAPHHAGIIHWLNENLRHAVPIKLFNDVMFGPVHAVQATEVIKDMLSREIYGVFNLGSSDYCSKAVFAEKVAVRYELSLEHTTVCSIDDVPMKTHRPKDMRMSTARLAERLGYTLPSIADAMAYIGPESGGAYDK